MMKPSPFVLRHAELHRLHAKAGFGRSLMQGKLLFGTHALRYPLIALLTSRDLGPARHAVAQRSVAGTVAYVLAGPVKVPSASPPPKPPST